MIGRMAEPQSFDELRRMGLSAYTSFHGLVTDPRALAEWRAGAEGPQLDMIVEFTRLASTLPPPVEHLSLRAIANAASAASAGRLRDYHSLTAATGRHAEAIPLDEWFGTVLTRLQRLVPEALQGDVVWAGDPPTFGLDELADRAVRYAQQVSTQQTFAGMLSVFLVLLRDWAHDLEPWLAERGFSIDNWIWNVADLAPKEEVQDDPWPGFELLVRERTSRPGPRDAFEVMARIGTLRPLALPTMSASEATVSADEPPAPEPPPTPRADPAARPSTTLSSDLSTDDDQLEYALYADAIASFIRDERTRAPLTIGIKAPWGAGKTSLMRMIRKRLDPGAPTGPPRVGAAPRLKLWELLRKTRGKSPDQAAAELEPDHVDTGGRRTTIWFNAWKYQSGEQVWAGLAHAILTQVSDRLTPLDRDRLWASIQVRRVSADQLRRRFYSYLAVRLVPYLLAIPLAVLVVLVLGVIDDSLVPGASIVGAVTIVASAVVGVVRSFRDEVTKATPQLVQAPDYESRLGFLHLVDTDMRRILDVAGATSEEPFVIFVDDLDRCSYTTVSQVIEALNVFLAGDFDNCIFVIAMEPDLVAAQIHVAYEKLFEQLDDGGGDLGWRFLEKMVQLPLSLPEPQPPQVERFLDSILAVRAEQQIAEIADDAPEVVEARQRISAAETSGSLAGVGEAYDKVRAAYPVQDARADAVVQKAARLEFADRFSDREAREMLLRFANELSGNPREIKRFVNVFRFYAYIDFWRRTQGLETPGLEGAGKFARLAVGWPSLLSALAGDVRVDGDTRVPLLQALETTSADGWQAAIAHAPKRAQPLLDDPRLRDVVRGDPHIGAAAANFL
jgi:hypothetical protein